jgi:hypothetical protein
MNKTDITAIVPISIIPTHPDTAIIEETIRSIRHHLPESEIILQIDGLRKERAGKKPEYDELKNRVLWKCMHEWGNVLPFIFEEHSHQTTMMKKTIDEVQTSLILYVESDTPLVIDKQLDWEECLNMIEYEKAKTIRFHFEEVIPEPHEYLMFEKEGNFIKTIQWSQRPHLSLTKYYRDSVLPYSNEKTFIEDRFHGKVQDDGWDEHKLWIYHPDGGIKRSYHLDGRAGTRKFTSDDNDWGYKEWD